MTNELVPSRQLNLERANILVLDGDIMSMSITTQILSGFGAKNIHRCESDDDARRVAEVQDFDLVVIDTSAIGLAGHEFVKWLRRDGLGSNRFAPVLVVTGHTQLSRVQAARDSGANFVLAKPLTPASLLQRIQWLARDRRTFVDCPAYAGPERRFKFDGPPPGSPGRRAEDQSSLVGSARDPNMSQAEIDSMMQPRRIAL
jgi:CheY-like chemotaxis protein